jgi:hypothetical protein
MRAAEPITAVVAPGLILATLPEKDLFRPQRALLESVAGVL